MENGDDTNWISKHRTLLAIIIFALVALYVIARFSPSIQVETLLPTPQGNTAQIDRDTSGQSVSEYNPAPAFVEDAVESDIASPSGRLIIKNASLDITVENIDTTNQEIQRLTQELDGFVTHASVGTYSSKAESKYGTITIRVPAEQFDAAIAVIKGMAEIVTSESITGKDVTEEYTDLNARLRNLEATEAELRELFERTGSIEEILKVQQQLTAIRGQIETTKGRMQYLEESAELSSITITLSEEDPIVNNEWDIVTIAEEAIRDLITSLQNLTGSLIYAIIFYGPYLLVIGIIVLVAYKLFKKKPTQ